MHTCISSHGLTRSWRSCPRRVNAGNKNTPSMHAPSTKTKCDYTYAKISPKSGEPQRYSWGTHTKQKKKKKKNNEAVWRRRRRRRESPDLPGTLSTPVQAAYHHGGSLPTAISHDWLPLQTLLQAALLSMKSLCWRWRWWTRWRQQRRRRWFVCLLVGCLTSQQHATVSPGRICTDNFTCCHTEIEVADQTFYLTQSQYTDTGPTSPSADPITPGAWQGSHWGANV